MTGHGLQVDVRIHTQKPTNHAVVNSFKMVREQLGYPVKYLFLLMSGD